MIRQSTIDEILKQIGIMFPDAECELTHRNSFELLIAVVLSAQCTDALVNKVTPGLFKKYRSAYDFQKVPLEELENDIRSIGLFRSKAKHIKALSEILVQSYRGNVPTTFEELVKLPGVGRKTANVVLSVAFGVPAIAVDTHVERVSKRLKIAPKNASVIEVEEALMKKVPKDQWSQTHHRFIFFGRYHCKAQNPKCDMCPLLHVCAEGKKRQKGRKMQ